MMLSNLSIHLSHLFHLLTALASAATTVATCQGGVFDTHRGADGADEMSRATEWRGHAHWLDVRTVRGSVHIHASRDGTIEVRARQTPASSSLSSTPSFTLRAVPRGHGVVVCVVPIEPRADPTSCPLDDRDWQGQRAPVVDLDVRVPESVILHASGA